MTALLNDAAGFHHQDHVGGQNGGQAVGDGQGGAAVGEGGEGVLDRPLSSGVHRRGGLVEDENRRVFQQCAGNRHPLLFAAGQAVAAFAHHGVVTVGQGRDEVVDVRRPSRPFDLLVAGIGTGIAQVLADRGMKQKRLLIDHADVFAQRLQRQVAHIDAVDAHLAGAHVVQAWRQIGDGCLARAGRTNQRRERPRRSCEAHPAQCWFAAAPVAEGHILKADFAARVGQRHGSRPVGDLLL